MDRITAPTHSSMVRSSLSKKVEQDKASCPKHSQRVAKNERNSSAQVRETRRRDARRWWEESAQFLIHAAACNSCKFRLFHTDPWTRKIIYPPHVQDIVFGEKDKEEREINCDRWREEKQSESPPLFFPHKIVLSNVFRDNLKALTWKHFKEPSLEHRV